jgi:NTP pyrophosphatase (non-canonical NTP hydrolase)
VITVQEKARELVAQFKTTPHIRLLDMSAELGEVSKAYLTATTYGQQAFQNSDHWELLGDVYCSLLYLAHSTGVGLEDALHKAMAKYQSRRDLKSSISSQSLGYYSES